MLTTDLIRVRRRGTHLHVSPLSAPQRARMLHLAEQYITITHAHQAQNRARAELDAACDDVPHDATDYKLVKGLRKLLLDRCTFEMPDGIEPSELRQTVFRHAAVVRQALPESDRFDAAATLTNAAAELQLAPDLVERDLFADLQENHRLRHFEALSAAALVDTYEMSQQQAVLLRAVRVIVRLRPRTPGAARVFFRQLKFRRLLFSVEQPNDGSYVITIDGPYSLFQAVTKYGLQLALLLPALNEAGAWELDADILWGREREPLAFHLEGNATSDNSDGDVAAHLPDDVAALFERFVARGASPGRPWGVEVAGNMLRLPGVGLCIPDLVFTHADTGLRVYLEVMGYWSRSAVWQRVELIRAGMPEPIIFAVSHRLRISEEVLSEDLPGQLYVYKSAISASVIEERLDAIIVRWRGAET